MNISEALSKYKLLIIIVLLFLLVFSLRAEAANLSSISDSDKAFYQDANGLPYFSEMDSYYNYRMTQDYLDHGYLGDTKINGTNWDLHSYYPPGREAEYSPLIVYTTAFTYKFVNLFSNVPLTTVAFWIGALIASLAVIPAYLFIRRITNDYGGITAAILVATAPAYFSHTFAGFFDTDQFNIILPLFTVWFFVESLRSKDMKNRAIFSVLSVVFMILFSLAWEGWIYIFYILIISAIIYLLVSNYLLGWKTIEKPGKYASKKEWFFNQPGIFTLVLFIVLSSLMIILMGGSSNFVSSLLGPIGFTQIQESVKVATSYPNVLVSVAELQIPSVMDAINNVGGIVVFAFGLLGVFLMFWRLKTGKKEATEISETEKDKPKNKGKPEKKKSTKKRRRRKEKSKAKEIQKENIKKSQIPDLGPEDKHNYLFCGILLLIWILVTVYALTKGVRFAEALSLPIALSAGIFIGLMREYIKGYISSISLQRVVMVVLILAAIFAPVYSGFAISYSVTPGTDDSMVSSLNWIKDNTPSNTVITSWWDYGHLFAAIADRPVTFDGATQNSPRGYWVGKALSTDNETLSVGILRMLSSSGDSGPNTVEAYTKNTGKSVEILNSILGVDKTTATTILTTTYGFTAEQAQNITQYTHPDNPAPNVLITSSDMVGKAGWWSYFGNWNFQTNNSTALNYVEGQGVIIPSNMTGLNNTTVIIANNAVFAEITDNNVTAGIINVEQVQNQNMSTSELVSQIISGISSNSSSLVVKPHRLIVMKDDNITQNEIVSNDSLYSIVIVNNNGTYDTYMMNKELEDSMFTRLYILRGQNITQFTLDYEQPGVMVWKVV